MAVAENLTPSSAIAPTQAAALPARADARAVRLYFLLLTALGLAAFALGVRDRWTPDLFAVAPPVDLLPPFGEQAWYTAFVRHQQDPVFAACGGVESLAQFKVLYWWEWLRRGTLLLLGGTFVSGCAFAALLPEYRFALKRLAAIGLIGAGYLAAVLLLGVGQARVEDIARYDVGQYRHALDVTFASVALALALSAAFGQLKPVRMSGAGLFYLALLVLDIGAGALFAARDAGTVWRDFPGYEASAFPPLDRLTAYAPVWLNFTFNQYMIQLVHRLLSVGLWIALVVNLILSSRRNPSAVIPAAALLALVTAELAGGIAALWLGASASFAHQIGAILLLAGAFLAFTAPRRGRGSAPPRGMGAAAAPFPLPPLPAQAR
jgi:cytochrome c oxidase assembly protein subunit 15